MELGFSIDYDHFIMVFIVFIMVDKIQNFNKNIFFILNLILSKLFLFKKSFYKKGPKLIYLNPIIFKFENLILYLMSFKGFKLKFLENLSKLIEKFKCLIL